ncbi:hypothetical protein HNP24_000173 [Chryseobacterium sediminis]|uniref:Uncharacterized protein n=1 Tax=Chryseobacterium sediminis TaxID=1679494 RepID=A0ABR6PWF1_9FLAO|nr:hypothetical protein [Chryseobacterium sediminis]MBB6329223.1 hypothetical protein [Chryseobacterium sediminis]
MKRLPLEPEKVSWEINGNEFSFHTIENNEDSLDLYVNASVNVLVNVTDDSVEIDFENIQIKFKNIRNMFLTKNILYPGYDDPFFDYKRYDTSDWGSILEISNIEKGIIWKRDKICPDPRFYFIENMEDLNHYKIVTDDYELDVVCKEYDYDSIVE